MPLTFLDFSELVAAPGEGAVPTTNPPGDMWLTGCHGGAVITGRWLSLGSVAIPVEHASIAVGHGRVRGALRTLDGRLVDLGSVYEAYAAS